MTAGILDQFLFAALPYVAIFVCIAVGLWRYLAMPFTYSSLSSQFLENRQQFWGAVPFHYGIITIIMGHLVGFLIPRQVLLWNARPLRLYVLEISALVFGLLALLGLLMLISRRATIVRIRKFTSIADWLVYALLTVQVVSGLYIALFHPWGTSWFASVMVPYLWSIFKLTPDIAQISAMPLAIKIHLVNASLFVALMPFSRLVHIFVAPLWYPFRKPQVVRWYKDRAVARAGVTE